MGILVAKHYPTSLFANQADHTYVQCSTGAKAWSCWGGKTGGSELRRATGSTSRANCIAHSDEKAGIKCYLINGVCHQAANRILLPAGITVRGARGYGISEAMFGVYGRVGFWPCSSPFTKCESTSGDFAGCAVPANTIKAPAHARSHTDQLDWVYTRSVLALYAKAETIRAPKAAASGAARKSATASAAKAETFHVALFAHMADFKLGPMLDKPLERRIIAIRRATEKERMKAERAYSQGELSSAEFISTFDRITLDFQDQMAHAMTPSEYLTLFDLEPGDKVVLTDETVVRNAFRSDR